MIDLTQLLIGFAGGSVIVGSAIYAWVSQRKNAASVASVPPAPSQAEGDNPELKLALSEAYQQGFDAGRKDAQAHGREILDAKLEAERERAFREGYEKGLDEGRSAFNVNIQPFYRKEKGKWVAFRKFRYIYGFNYQLFVNGLPSMNPFERILGEETDTELDADEIEKRVHSLLASAVSGAFEGIPGAATVSKLIEKK